MTAKDRGPEGTNPARGTGTAAETATISAPSIRTAANSLEGAAPSAPPPAARPPQSILRFPRHSAFRISHSELAFAAIAFLLPAAPFAFAAGELSITSTSAQIQNFDSLGNSTTATIPVGWLLSGAGGGNTTTWSGANISATTRGASSGSPTNGGIYNWGSNATDRALGFMTSGSYASPNSILYGIINNTGGLVTSIDLAFDYERYRINTSAASVAFSYSLDGTTWTADSRGDSGAFSTGNSSYTFSGGTVVSQGFTLSGLNLANATPFYFRWNFNTTNTNSQGIGLDNVSLTLNAASTAFTTWTGTGSGGTWQNAATGSFGGAYSNDLANTVSFTGIAETVTATGTPQAGSLAFTTAGYTLAGAVQLGIGTITAPAGTTTISANISGNGSSGLTKEGPGTLILSGTNSYTGTTTVSAGTLTLSGGNAIPDAGTISLANTAGVQLNVSSSETIASLQGGGTTGGNVSLASGQTLTIAEAGSNTFAGILSGPGTLAKSGAGNLTLTGTNTYSGGTFVTAGRLTGSTASLQGAITNNAAVTFNQTTDGTYSSAMGGTGTLAKEGNANLTLSGANSYSGGTTLSSGTITASHNSALGAGAVTITSGTVQATSGISLANNFTIGSPGYTGFGPTTLVAGWEFNAVTSAGVDDFKASTLADGVTNTTGLTRAPNPDGWQGTGIYVPDGPPSRAWGARGWNSANQSAAIQAGDFFTFSLTANAGSTLRFDSINPFDYRRSDGGPPTGALQYAIDGTNFTDIASLAYTSNSSSGATLPVVSLSSIPDLSAGQTITFRVINWGAPELIGSFYLYDTGGDPAAVDFAIRGQVAAPTPGTGSATLGLDSGGSATFSGNLTIHGAATLHAASGATASFSGDFSGSGSATKTGPGAVILSGSAAHAGGTTVSEGTLRVNGTHASAITVSSGATLGGNGTVSGLVTLNSGANLTPGNSVGNLNLNGGLTLNSTSTLTMEIDGGSAFDTINVGSGSLTYAGTLSLVFGYTPAVNATYQLFTGTSVAGATGNFASLTFNNPEYQGTFNPTSGVLTLTAIPEPKTWALLALGALSLLWINRKKSPLRFPNHAASQAVTNPNPIIPQA